MAFKLYASDLTGACWAGREQFKKVFGEDGVFVNKRNLKKWRRLGGPWAVTRAAYHLPPLMNNAQKAEYGQRTANLPAKHDVHGPTCRRCLGLADAAVDILQHGPRRV